MIEVQDPIDVEAALEQMRDSKRRVQVTMLDPWYNKGVGGLRDDYEDYISNLLELAATFSDHIYLWGFPEIIASFVKRVPATHRLNAWLTWYYKNNPSVIRGWRSAQMACLHLTTPDAVMYPQHFLNEAQRQKQAEGKLRYMPGPTSVIEGALRIGFVGKNEQTGHPAQKPIVVYEPLILMATTEGDTVFDPMCGSGTTGEVCYRLRRSAIISDISPEYTEIARNRMAKLEGTEPSGPTPTPPKSKTPVRDSDEGALLPLSAEANS